MRKTLAILLLPLGIFTGIAARQAYSNAPRSYYGGGRQNRSGASNSYGGGSRPPLNLNRPIMRHALPAAAVPPVATTEVAGQPTPITATNSASAEAEVN
jgi:hypothetical protein